MTPPSTSTPPPSPASTTTPPPDTTGADTRGHAVTDPVLTTAPGEPASPRATPRKPIDSHPPVTSGCAGTRVEQAIRHGHLVTARGFPPHPTPRAWEPLNARAAPP